MDALGESAQTNSDPTGQDCLLINPSVKLRIQGGMVTI